MDQPSSDPRVECRSGFTYAERPLALHWQDRRLEVEQVLEERRTPEGRYFRVVAAAQVFDLFYNERQDKWIIQPG